MKNPRVTTRGSAQGRGHHARYTSRACAGGDITGGESPLPRQSGWAKDWLPDAEPIVSCTNTESRKEGPVNGPFPYIALPVGSRLVDLDVPSYENSAGHVAGR